jgi:hypothetical protein
MEEMKAEVKYYDVPEGSDWYMRFDVLFIKRDHRRILNRQPKVYFCEEGLVFMFNELVMSN